MKHNKIQKQISKTDADRKAAYRMMYKSLQMGSILMRLNLAARIITQYDMSKAEIKNCRKKIKAVKQARKAQKRTL